MVRAIFGFLGALLRLALLVGAITGMAMLLLRIDGPPRLPAHWPSLEEIRFTLQLGGVPNEVLIYLIAQGLWLLLGYLVLACLLEAVATILEVLAAGVAGVRGLRRTADAVAPGFVRRVVSGLLLALLTVWLSLRPPSTVAAPAAPTTVSRVIDRPAPAVGAPSAPPAPLAVARDEHGDLRLLTPADAAAACLAGVRHTVVRGDNLVDLALRYYGDANAWTAIWEANQGRTMANGRAFDNPSLIYPGDILIIPERPDARPTRLVDHVVQSGETLHAIAQRHLGDEAKWPVIFEANRGRPAPGNRYLVHPDLIWPGMTLRIPLPLAAAPAPPTTAEAGPATAGPGEPLGIPVPGSPPLAPARPPLDPAREAADARAAWARLQAAAEAEARANATVRPVTPAPVAPPATAATHEQTSTPAQPAPAPEAPASETPAPGAPFTAADLPLEGLLAGAAALAATLGYRALRRRLAASEPDRRLLPFHFPARPTIDHATGLASQPLAPQASQRHRGVEADPRHAVTALVLEALARAGWPAAQVVSLCAGDERLIFRLRLGAPLPADLDPLLEVLEDEVLALIEAWPGERDELWLTLDELSPRQAWRAGYDLPLAPLVTIGQTDEGVLSVALDALDGGLLVIGEHASLALERALISLAALYPPTALRVVLLAGEPLAGALADLPHLLQPPVSPADPTARPLLAGLLEELRCRQAAEEADGALIVLAIDEPAAIDGAHLRELAREGGPYGIYTLLAATEPSMLAPALRDACPGQLLTGTVGAGTDERSPDDAPEMAPSPSLARWRMVGEPALPVRALRILPDDRRALLATMAAAVAAVAPVATEPVPTVDDGLAPTPGHPTENGTHHPIEPDGRTERLDVIASASVAENRHRPAMLDPAGANGSHPLNGAHSSASMPVSHTVGPSPDTTAPRAEDDHTDESTVSIQGDDSPSAAVRVVPSTIAQPAPSEAEAAPSGAARTNGHHQSGKLDQQRHPDNGLGVTATDEVAAAVTGLPAPAEDAFGPRPGMLRLRLFGVPGLFDASGRAIGFGRGQLGLRILIYLALQGEAGAVADSLAAHVWPLAGSEEDDNLLEHGNDDKVRQAVRRLRQVLARHLPPAADPVSFESSTYRLNPAVIWSDVAAFNACVGAARRQTTDAGAAAPLRAALKYYRAPLADKVSERWFDPVWLDQERAHYLEQLRKVGLWAAAVLAHMDDFAGAVEVYRQLRDVSIVDDEIAQLELICQALRGERALIAQSYDEHAAALGRLGMRPWKATVALYDQLMTGPVTAELRQRSVSPGR